MVKDIESWPCPQQSAWQRVNRSFMSSLLEPCPNSAGVAFPRAAAPCIPSPSLFPPYFRGKQFMFSHGVSGTALLNATQLPSSQKKLLVFDQCGTQTRLMYSSATPNAELTKVMCLDERAAKVDWIDQVKSVSHIELGEDYERGDESELHEDTEELNALLYSDNDEDDYSDEEKSTGHSPMPNIECYGNQHEFEEVSSFSVPKKRQAHEEEGSDSNGPNKRQKFLQPYDTSNYAESSCAIRKMRRDVTGSVSHEYDYAESSCAMRKMRRDVILETFRVLEGIVPGVKGKDPVLVLDKAIEYLKCLKLKAVALGVDSLKAQ